MGLHVSEVAFGALTFGIGADEAAAGPLIDRYLELGGNFIDTANSYGPRTSEEVLGRLLKGRRNSVVLATKVRQAMGPDPLDQGLSRRHILQSVDASLARLQTDFIDLYQIHFWDNFTPVEETLEALDQCVQSGNVRYLGCSNLAGWQLMKALGISERRGLSNFVSLQPEYSLVCRGIERELVPACLDAGIGILPFSPLAGGFLTGKYAKDEAPPPDSRGARSLAGHRAWQWERRAGERGFAILDAARRVAGEVNRPLSQVALRWVMDRPGVVSPIIGARTVEQLDETLAGLDWRLSAEQRTRLDEASAFPLDYPYDVSVELNRLNNPYGSGPS